MKKDSYVRVHAVLFSLVLNLLVTHVMAEEFHYAHIYKTTQSCEESKESILAELRKLGAYVEYIGMGLSSGKIIQPRPTRMDSSYISNQYYDVPSNRMDTLFVPLAGDARHLWSNIMRSPKYLPTLSARVMAACKGIGLVAYDHWWEDSVYYGYFPDETVRLFKEVQSSRSRPNPNMKEIQTVEGVRRTINWGYRYNPYGLLP